MDYMEQAERLAKNLCRPHPPPQLHLSEKHPRRPGHLPDGVREAADGAPGVREPEHERAYILRMAVNACKDLLKSPWRQRSESLDEGLQVPAPEAADGSVLEAVEQLPPLYRAVIYLFYYEGYQAAEIGKILGLPTATVPHPALPGAGEAERTFGRIRL